MDQTDEKKSTAKSSNTSMGSKSGATSMADLMKKSQSSLVTLKKGEVVKGVITKLTSSEILVDVGAKTEAQVLEKEKSILRAILSSLKVGDHVSVSILNPESDQGNPVVSLRRYMEEISWAKLEKFLKEKAVIDVTVTGSTRGGFLVESEFGKSGFLPNSHTVLSGTEGSIIGKKIKTSIVELSRTQNKIIFSQKATIDPKEFEKSVKGLKNGEKIDALVNNLTPFGIFVSFEFHGKSIEGFIHISEVSWDKVDNLEDKFKTGEKIEALIVDIDKESRRVNLSIRKLNKDPFIEATSKFSPDMKVMGVVRTVGDSGVTLDLNGGIEGFIKKDKIPPTVSYKTGQEVEIIVGEVDKKRRRVVASPVLVAKPIGYR